MKINTISAYLLVYLLARGHWNLMVPVRAEEESDVSSGSASADAGSATNGAAEATPLTGSAAPEGSTSGTDAGLTSTDGSANGATTDAGSALTSEAAEGSADAGHVPGESADAGSSGEAGEARTGAVELGSLYPDFFTGGMSADEAPMTNPELVAKRDEARRLAENARKTADELIRAAVKLMEDADDISKAIEVSGIVEDFNVELEKFTYNLKMDRTKAAEVAKPPDMMYYSGFPDGHHRYDAGADDLIKREMKWKDNVFYYDSFPDGHHNFDHDTLKGVRERDEVLTKNMLYYFGFPDGWHKRADFELLERIHREARRNELKGAIDAKKSELVNLKKQIDELTTLFNSVDADVKKLEEEHNELILLLLGLDATLIKLYKADSDDNPVLMEENTDYEKKKAHGDLRFEFKSGAVCTLVKFGEHELWKKGVESVNVPKLVAFNGTMGLIAVRDNDRAVLYKKEANSDEWKHHNTILRKTPGSTGSRSTTLTGSPAQSGTTSTLASSSTLAGSKMNLEAGSTGTPETPESLDETASVASGEGSESNEANEADSGTALRGSTEGSAGLASEGSTDGGSSGEGYAGLASEGSTDGGSSAGGSSGQGISSGDYSSVFMD